MIDISVLKIGNYVHVVDRSGDKLVSEDIELTFDKLCNSNWSAIDIYGIAVDPTQLKSKLGFMERSLRDKNGNLMISMVKSVEYGGLYYIITIDQPQLGVYRLSIELNRENLCTAKVEYIHQVQNFISTTTNHDVR